jgi:hypothetical protein
MFYTAMARDADWGKDIPDMLRNEEWNYAVFTAAKQHRPGVNQAECLACHKPLDNTSYLFTLKQLADAVKSEINPGCRFFQPPAGGFFISVFPISGLQLRIP